MHFPKQNIVNPIMSSTWNFIPHAFIVPYSHWNGLKFSFFCTVLRLWNCFPLEKLIPLNSTCLHFFCPLMYVFIIIIITIIILLLLLLLLLHQNRCKQESVREQRMIEKKEYIEQWPRLFPIATEGLRAPGLATGYIHTQKKKRTKINPENEYNFLMVK